MRRGDGGKRSFVHRPSSPSPFRERGEGDFPRFPVPTSKAPFRERGKGGVKRENYGVSSRRSSFSEMSLKRCCDYCGFVLYYIAILLYERRKKFIMKNSSILRLTAAGLLIAVGIVIPMFSPFKIVVPPASFTLASHVAIFIAMFISVGVAATVAVGTTLGFFLGGFSIVIVYRAASHLLFATLGALYLQKMRKASSLSAVGLRVFSFCIALLHAVAEVVVVSVFYFGGDMSALYYQTGFLTSVLLLVGLGTVVHSMVDFEIANVVRLALRRQVDLEGMLVQK